MGATAREVALNCLLAGEKQSGVWSDAYLHDAIRRAALSGRDAGLCTRLTFGVLQNQMLLDWHIARLSSVPPERLDPTARTCLRLGIYQMAFMDRIPVHAAIYESVALTKKRSRNPRSANLVNAVLRAFDRLRSAPLPQPEELWIRYSHPRWLAETFSERLSEGELEAWLKANNAQPLTQAQVNTIKTTPQALILELNAAGVTAANHPWLPNCLELEGAGALEELEAFREGRFYIQDAAARSAVLAADPKPGMEILDACAAPGGKSFAAAIGMGCKGNILSCDIHPNKQRLIESGAQRLGLTCIKTAVMDGKRFEPTLENHFDLVIADVPCSGLGIIRKKPDIRYKDPEALKGLPRIQRDILMNVARYVKPGGILLYATCTLLKNENEDIVEWFLKENGTFCLEPFDLPDPVGATKGMVTLWPHIHGTDGFFFAKLRRSTSLVGK